MLVAARDKDGKPIVFATDYPNAPTLFNGKWHGMGCGIALELPEAEPFCTNIPPGEKRIIESLSVTYRPEPNTAVEELVEAALTFRSSYTAGVLTGAIPSISVEMLFSALARVEAEKKGGN